MEHHPSGRHRRPRQSLAGRVWALTAALLAIALAAVFVPQYPQRPRRERAAITPPPRRRELPPAPSRRRPGAQKPPGFPDDAWRRNRHRDDRHGTDPDEAAGALVRPYMPPFPRVPVGDLLAEPAQPASPTAPVRDVPDDMGDLADAIRLYLDRVG